MSSKFSSSRHGIVFNHYKGDAKDIIAKIDSGYASFVASLFNITQ